MLAYLQKKYNFNLDGWEVKCKVRSREGCFLYDWRFVPPNKSPIRSEIGLVRYFVSIRTAMW